MTTSAIQEKTQPAETRARLALDALRKIARLGCSLRRIDRRDAKFNCLIEKRAAKFPLVAAPHLCRSCIAQETIETLESGSGDEKPE